MESEVKLRFARPEVMDSVVLAPWFCSYLLSKDSTQMSLYNTYFDTDDFSLRALKAVARVRKINDKSFIHTVKVSIDQIDGLHQRLEWNCDLDASEFDPMMFLKSIQNPCDSIEQLEHILMPIMNVEINSILETVFDRETFIIKFRSCQIEVALDIGEIRAGGAVEPICEMELELMNGSLADLLTFSQMVRDRAPCSLENMSKYGRAVRLLEKEMK